MGLGEDSAVEMTLVDGQLVVRAADCDVLSLDKLLQRVTEENQHGEWPSWPFVGAESRESVRGEFA